MHRRRACYSAVDSVRLGLGIRDVLRPSEHQRTDVLPERATGAVRAIAPGDCTEQRGGTPGFFGSRETEAAKMCRIGAAWKPVLAMVNKNS